MDLETLAALVLWGTVVGVDLVTFPQGLLARPLVAAAVAGLIVGDPEAGVVLGVALELFALDVLPVGAARYPDYGPPAVAAVVVLAQRPWPQALGYAVTLGLGLAVLGGWTLVWLRHANDRTVQRYAAGLAAGNPRTIALVQWRGVFRDVARSFALTAVGLALAMAVREAVPAGAHPGLVTAVAVGTGLAAAAGGAIRNAGRGARLRWLGGGVLLGMLVVMLR
jgi:PTS system mannose-specific IIC component